MLTVHLHHFIASYGYFAVAGLVGIECIGVPVPGEAALITAAVYAGVTGRLDIIAVIASAAAGAVVGGSAGYGLGRWFGTIVLQRWGRYVGLRAHHHDLLGSLFASHGAKLVFFGRFFAILRIAVALFAGASRMPWRRFLFANIAGALSWAIGFGLAAYWLGNAVFHFAAPLAVAVVIVGGLGIAIAHRLGHRALFRSLNRRHDHVQARPNTPRAANAGQLHRAP